MLRAQSARDVPQRAEYGVRDVVLGFLPEAGGVQRFFRCEEDEVDSGIRRGHGRRRLDGELPRLWTWMGVWRSRSRLRRASERSGHRGAHEPGRRLRHAQRRKELDPALHRADGAESRALDYAVEWPRRHVGVEPLSEGSTNLPRQYRHRHGRAGRRWTVGSDYFGWSDELEYVLRARDRRRGRAHLGGGVPGARHPLR